MHAAIDVNCLAPQSPGGYWNLVDTIHQRESDIAGEGGQQSLPAAIQKLDDATRAEGKHQNVDLGKLNACIAKQDDSGIRDSIRQGETLGVDGTPTLFINGERATGALSENMLWSIIDRALIDAGQVPPPEDSPVNGDSQAKPTVPSGK
jgi:protein-disulfide isomerase